MKAPGEKNEILIIRRIVAGIFLLGATITLVELILIGHTEDVWQWVPLLILPAGILLLILSALTRFSAVARIFQITMILCLISGFVGVGLHYKAKVEFKLETNPSLNGWELMSEAIRGSTLPPVLAPGMMIQLGLLGWAYTFKHPLFLTKKNQRMEYEKN